MKFMYEKKNFKAMEEIQYSATKKDICYMRWFMLYLHNLAHMYM